MVFGGKWFLSNKFSTNSPGLGDRQPNNCWIKKYKMLVQPSLNMLYYRARKYWLGTNFYSLLIYTKYSFSYIDNIAWRDMALGQASANVYIIQYLVKIHFQKMLFTELSSLKSLYIRSRTRK